MSLSKENLRVRDIFDLAAKEASLSTALGPIPAPETQKLIESLNPEVHATVEIVRRRDASDMDSEAYLLVWFNRGEANERYLEHRLESSAAEKETEVNERAVDWCNPK